MENSFELNVVNYLYRLKKSVIDRLNEGTTQLLMLVIVIFLIVAIIKQIYILMFILIGQLIFFLAPVIFFECRSYIYSIKVYENKIEFNYLSFFKSKMIIEEFENIRIIEYGHTPGSITANNFKIYRDFGKGHRKILINQYEILDWSNQENKERLKQILSKSIH